MCPVSAKLGEGTGCFGAPVETGVGLSTGAEIPPVGGLEAMLHA